MNPLTRARAFLGYTQEEMARALGISRATYQRREAMGEDYATEPSITTERTHVKVLVAQEAVERVFRP
jgi:DNA-binding XRE family transcriptional regulator